MRDWLSHRVASSPDDTALVRAEDGEAWTYADLDRLVSETAGRLSAHGLGEGDRIGVLTPPYVGTVGLVHAVMRLGATFVPLGQDLTEREIAARIDGTDLDAVVCAESTESAATDAATEFDGVPVYSVDDPVSAVATGVHDVQPTVVDPPEWSFADPLCVLFTSGTTGEPKPVPLTAGNVYASAVASAFRLGVDPDDRWLVSLALHHMGGLAPVHHTVLYGTTLVLREGFDAGGTADDIDAYDVTGVSLVPTMLQRMLDRRGTLSESLRVVLLGGAPAPESLLERCRDYSVPVYPTYGMTESASQIATATPSQTKGRLNSVGRPLFRTNVTVVDEDGEPLPPGETGEIAVDGPTVTPGYLAPDGADASPVDGGGETAGTGDGTATDGGDADAAVGVTGIDSADLDRSEFGPHGLRTGDVGRVDEDGYLHVLNRVGDRIITGGENVEPGEVVGVLREFPAIANAAVVGLDDDVWGERVGALLAVDDRGSNDADGSDARAPIDESALVSFAGERLSEFKIPRTVAYTDELPRTVSGTIDREAVRERLREDGTDPRSDADLEAAGFTPADPADSDEATEAETNDGGPSADGERSAAESDAAPTSDAEETEDAEEPGDEEPDGESDPDASRSVSRGE